MVIFLPLTSATAVMQERIASPSESTVHAPQRPAPQPYFVPVSASSSRKTHKRGVSGDAEMMRCFPFTVNLMSAMWWLLFLVSSRA